MRFADQRTNSISEQPAGQIKVELDSAIEKEKELS
ncbi:hypothetical protein PITCH_A840059 [uncultured Desulfobacterium sp.]|uniref:Uncharacterized protein n=1 Tax=uncultured Desulfobacterium sp. TaxID=201089 RepID=A0A445N3A8_9BACT|nr:hypothetical protein PITCH_A840059 [uncultured Desulfobacterium sp.]